MIPHLFFSAGFRGGRLDPTPPVDDSGTPSEVSVERVSRGTCIVHSAANILPIVPSPFALSVVSRKAIFLPLQTCTFRPFPREFNQINSFTDQLALVQKTCHLHSFILTLRTTPAARFCVLDSLNYSSTAQRHTSVTVPVSFTQWLPLQPSTGRASVQVSQN